MLTAKGLFVRDHEEKNQMSVHTGRVRGAKGTREQIIPSDQGQTEKSCNGGERIFGKIIQERSFGQNGSERIILKIIRGQNGR